MSLIFAEFATSLKLPKIDIAKNKPYYTSLVRVLEIVKIGLSENLTLSPSKCHFRQNFPMRKIPDIGYDGTRAAFNKQIRRIVVPRPATTLTLKRVKGQGHVMASLERAIFNNSEDMSQVKVFVTDRRREGQRDGRTNEI